MGKNNGHRFLLQACFIHLKNIIFAALRRDGSIYFEFLGR